MYSCKQYIYIETLQYYRSSGYASLLKMKNKTAGYDYTHFFNIQNFYNLFSTLQTLINHYTVHW